MKKLVTKTEELFESIDETIKALAKTDDVLDSIKSMDDESLIALRQCLKLVDQCKEYSLEMAAKIDTIEDINKKLDLVLSKM